VRGARILVAEDNEESLELLREYLEALEYTVAAATDGNRALDMGGTGQFDLMILDVHMPLYDGTEVLRMLRVRHRLRPIKVIALTADVLPETRQELDRAGVNGFLAKPVNLEALRLEIERVLGQG
jgi:two-component system, sensor histidine kinase and response regulator